MNELYTYWGIGVFCFYCASLFDWVGDTLVHHKQNIFNKIKNPWLHHYMNLEENWWERKYLPNKERKFWTVLGKKIVQPVAVQDGWHGFKLLRKWMNANMAFFFALPFISSFRLFEILLAYLSFVSMFGLIEYLNCITWYKKWLS